MKPVIYILIDPRDQRVRYVGYAQNFMRRMYWHFHDYRGKKNPTSTFPWISELCDLGMLPVGQVIEWLTSESDWQERERYWIKHYRDAGAPLLNITDGGYDGGWGWHRMTPERRAERIKKIRAQMPEVAEEFWKDKTPEQRREIMRARGLAKVAKHGPGGEHLLGNKLRLGIPTSSFQKSIASKSNRERWANYSPERRAEVTTNMRKAALARGPMTEEHKAKDRIAHQHKWALFTPEEREARLAVWHAKRRAAHG